MSWWANGGQVGGQNIRLYLIMHSRYKYGYQPPFLLPYSSLKVMSTIDIRYMCKMSSGR